MTEEERNWILDLPLTKQGNSLGVSIPRKILNAVRLVHGDRIRVVLTTKNDNE